MLVDLPPCPSRKREGPRDLRAQRVSRSGVGLSDVQLTPFRLWEGYPDCFWSPAVKIRYHHSPAIRVAHGVRIHRHVAYFRSSCCPSRNVNGAYLGRINIQPNGGHAQRAIFFQAPSLCRHGDRRAMVASQTDSASCDLPRDVVLRDSDPALPGAGREPALYEGAGPVAGPCGDGSPWRPDRCGTAARGGRSSCRRFPDRTGRQTPPL